MATMQPPPHDISPTVDAIIVGHGLAGTLLAWQMETHGASIHLIGNDRLPAASRVAAGLFNPVIGKHLALQARAEQTIDDAMSLYRQLEQHFHCKLFYPEPMLRIFRNAEERDIHANRRRDPAYSPYLGPAIQPESSVRAPFGACLQQQTGYLDTNALLDTLHAHFRQTGTLIDAAFDPDALGIEPSCVRWHGITGRHIIFCEGYRGALNPWFDWLPFQPAGGEILTFKSNTPLPPEILNGGKWLMPRHDGSYKTGATYRHSPQSEASDSGRRELLAGLNGLLRDTPEIEIAAHEAGTRSASRDKQPLVGSHPRYSQLALFNGFGSHGSMLIPHHARAFAEHLLNGEALPGSCDIARFKAPKRPLTLQVHEALKRRLNNGDITIDATAGNGFDTRFLAEQVGVAGHVHAFDIQSAAIEQSRKLLHEHNLLDRVSLHRCSHESMAESVPASQHGRIAAIIFNLGYLPGGDKALTTRREQTLNALATAANLLAPGGTLSILAYPGHPGGGEECEAVREWAEQLPSRYIVRMHPRPAPTSPEWTEIMLGREL